MLRKENPDLQILSCHDEYLLHTMLTSTAARRLRRPRTRTADRADRRGKGQGLPAARAIHDRLLPVTATVYHRGSHMEGTVALKEGLVHRGILEHATVRSPLLPLAAGAHEEIAAALDSANPALSRPPRSDRTGSSLAAIPVPLRPTSRWPEGRRISNSPRAQHV